MAGKSTHQPTATSSMKRISKKRPHGDLSGLSFAFFGEFRIWPSYHAASPPEVARRLGAAVRDSVDENLDYLVLGDKRGRGRAEAKKQAERLRARARKSSGSNTPSRPEVIDESAFREMVRLDLKGKRFAFFGGFDCCPAGFEDGLLSRMVEAVGGVVQSEVDERLNYLALGPRRGPGKIAARDRAEQLQAAGFAVDILDENSFLELVRTEQPKKTDSATDFASFISRLYGLVDQGKLGRSLRMLKGESFKLYVRRDADRLVGVVRSQTGVGTVYASWLTSDGHYGCSTPELDDCMGLQGSPCKHLLVLLVGLARSGQMDPATAYAWIHAARSKRPGSDTDLAADTFLQYKGAEPGEIDWRPIETIPEDYYAL
jgi:BRCT domain type II-containing protein